MSEKRGGWEVRAVRTGIPDLRLYPLIVYRDYAGGKLDADRRPALEIEVVACEPGEHCGHRISAAASPYLYSPSTPETDTYSFYVVRNEGQERQSSSDTESRTKGD